MIGGCSALRDGVRRSAKTAAVVRLPLISLAKASAPSTTATATAITAADDPASHRIRDSRALLLSSTRFHSPNISRNTVSSVISSARLDALLYRLAFRVFCFVL